MLIIILSLLLSVLLYLSSHQDGVLVATLLIF
jgi:hypothetical protein